MFLTFDQYIQYAARGVPGIDGADGAPGADGADGAPGADGVDATAPVGSIQLWVGDSADIPAKYLGCFGQFVSKTDYAELFDLWGSYFGSFPTTFGIVDLRDVIPIGAPYTGESTGLNVRDRDGSLIHTLSVAQLPAHHHTQQKFNATNTAGQVVLGSGASVTPVSQGINTQDTGSGSNISWLPSVIGVFFIVRALP
jgi:microcystin-dependent protein